MSPHQDMMSNSNLVGASHEEMLLMGGQIVCNKMSALLSTNSNETKSDAHGHVCYIKNLAPELRLEILLTLPDLESLHSLVQASPVLHAQYVHSRELVLGRFMLPQLDDILPDAMGFIMSTVSELGSIRPNAKIGEFLAWYATWQAEAATCPGVKDLKRSALAELVNFHFSTAVPLSKQFAAWAMRNMSSQASSPSPRLLCPAKGMFLSKTEQTRVFRAIYRYQTYQNLFGANGTRRHGQFDCKEIHDLFFAALPPWDIEIMTSLDLYLRDFYPPIFRKVQEIIEQKSVQEDPEGYIWSIVHRRHPSLYLSGTISHGLEVAMKMHRAQDNAEQLFRAANCCMTTFQQSDPSYQQAASTIPVNEYQRQPQWFPIDCSPNAPSAGWILSWNILSPLRYRGPLPRGLRRWVFTIWDQHRWDDRCAVFALYRQWEALHEAIDLSQQ